MIFAPTARAAFRQALDVDSATWARARGWALSISLVQIPFYRNSRPTIAELARRTLREALGGS